jgi:hypothetical protein
MPTFSREREKGYTPIATCPQPSSLAAAALALNKHGPLNFVPFLF